MIRLCVDARMIFSSGIGTCIRNLIPYLSKPPFELILLVGSKSRQDNQSVRFNSPIYSLAEQISFPWKIPSCDLFWSPHYNVPLLPIRARARAVTIHDVCHLAMPLSKPKRIIAKMLLQGACQKSEKIITDSDFSKSEILKYLNCPEQEIDVIYPGVDGTEFSPSLNTEEFKKRHNLETPFFLFVGNFKTHKNLSLLLKAFELLNPSGYDLVLTGKHTGLKSSDSEIFDLIQKSPLKEKIRLLGEVSKNDLPLLYASAKALVFPSLYEGFGLPPLEAMASGCPVLASTAASIPEICSDAALYFSPYSAENLASQMDQLLRKDSLRQELIQKGLIRCKEFSWERTATQYRTLFTSLSLNQSLR